MEGVLDSLTSQVRQPEDFPFVHVVLSYAHPTRKAETLIVSQPYLSY